MQISNSFCSHMFLMLRVSVQALRRGTCSSWLTRRAITAFLIMLLSCRYFRIYVSVLGVTPLQPCFGEFQLCGLECNVSLPSWYLPVFFPDPYSSSLARKTWVTPKRLWDRIVEKDVISCGRYKDISMAKSLHLDLKSQFFPKAFSYLNSNHIYSTPV